jgi:hypothetical protein
MAMPAAPSSALPHQDQDRAATRSALSRRGRHLGRAAFHREDPRAPARRRRRRRGAAEIELRYKKRLLSQRSNEDARNMGWVMDEREIDPLLNEAVLSPSRASG